MVQNSMLSPPTQAMLIEFTPGSLGLTHQIPTLFVHWDQRPLPLVHTSSMLFGTYKPQSHFVPAPYRVNAQIFALVTIKA